MRTIILLLCCLTSSQLFAQELKEYKGKVVKDGDYLLEGDFLGGCSWYCGGSVTKFSASSELAPQGKASYVVDKIHDFDFQSAWVEGKEGNGIGEYVDYIFDMNYEDAIPNLGITCAIVANGYKKNKKAWKENNRVKKMKVYVNGKAHSILSLADTFNLQVVELGGTIMLPLKEVTTVRFEILEVYSGSKFNDTAISELVFEGVGVH